MCAKFFLKKTSFCAGSHPFRKPQAGLWHLGDAEIEEEESVRSENNQDKGKSFSKTDSTLMTPCQRKAEAVKRKLDNELVASSLNSSVEENGRYKEKKRKTDRAKEAQL